MQENLSPLIQEFPWNSLSFSVSHTQARTIHKHFANVYARMYIFNFVCLGLIQDSYDWI